MTMHEIHPNHLPINRRCKRVLPERAKPTHELVDRIRSALQAGYVLAGHVGSRKVQLQICDAFNALRGLS
jgi:hypothetical protein